MKTLKIAATAFLTASFVAAVTVADGPALQSGPQVGKEVPGAFHPLNVTGPNAGKKHCLYCENGANPVAVIFARSVSPTLTTLIKKIDDCTDKNSKCEMGSFVVFVSNNEALAPQLEGLAKKEGIKHTILTIEPLPGPTDYEVAKDAEITVLLYNDFTVRANHAFRKGELNEKAIGQIVADVSKIIPAK